MELGDRDIIIYNNFFDDPCGDSLCIYERGR